MTEERKAAEHPALTDVRYALKQARIAQKATDRQNSLDATCRSNDALERVLEALLKPAEVTVYVRGGVVQDIDLPAGVRVTLYDYDDGDEGNGEDPDGEKCHVGIWELHE